MKYLTISAFFPALAILLFSNRLDAQNFYMEPPVSGGSSIEIRYLRPFDSNWTDIKGMSGNYQLDFQYRLTSGLSVVTLIPYNSAAMNEMETERSIGNIYLGIRMPSKNQKTSVSIGLNLPTASKEKMMPAMVGLVSDLYHIHQYLPEILSFYGNIAYHNDQNTPAIFGIEAGPNVWIATGEGDNEFLMHYAIESGYRFKGLSIFTELSGIMILSEEDISISDRTNHMLSLGAEYKIKKITPCVFYTFHLSEGFEDVTVLGIKLRIQL